jgi:hypothetical protein
MPMPHSRLNERIGVELTGGLANLRDITVTRS